MKNIKTAILTISSVLLLSLSTSTFADPEIESIDDCVVTIYNKSRSYTRLINLKNVDAIKGYKIKGDNVKIDLVSGGAEIGSILHLSAKKVKEITALYKKCSG